MAEISIKLAKVEEATRKKDEITNEFITQTKEQLETKMETHVEKREAIISDMKEKLKVKGKKTRQKEGETDLSLIADSCPGDREDARDFGAAKGQ